MNALAHFNPPGYSSIGVVNTAGLAFGPDRLDQRSGVGLGHRPDLRRAPRTGPAAVARPAGPGHRAPAPRATTRSWAWTSPSASGFQPTTPRRPLGPNARSFGHFGTGGALGFADPDAEVAFGYVMNHVIPRWQSDRNRALIDALYASLP